MEYIYASMLLHKAGQKVDEASVKKVLEAASVKVDEARVKALVSETAAKSKPPKQYLSFRSGSSPPQRIQSLSFIQLIEVSVQIFRFLVLNCISLLTPSLIAFVYWSFMYATRGVRPSPGFDFIQTFSSSQSSSSSSV